MNLQDFVGGSYPAQSKNANNQRTINWVPTISGTPGAEGKTPLILVGAPGMELWKTLGDQPIRGLHTVGNVLYAVTGQTVYKVLNNKIATNIGTLETTGGKVWIEHNANNEVGFVDGKRLYIYNSLTDTFFQPSPQPVLQPTSLMFINQRFVVSMENSMFFAISDINNGAGWDPTQIAAAESDPDPLQVVWNLHRQIYLLGTQTTEIWYDAGTSPFPFQPTSGVIDWGIVAVNSAAQVADTLAWLGIHKDGGISVVAASGLQATVISTPGLEARWSAYRTVSDAFAFSYRLDGNDCYVITFGAGGETFIYDFTTALWHERTSYDIGAWVSNEGVRFVNKQLVGDRTQGNIYRMSANIYHENGSPIVKTRRSPHIWNERKRFTVAALEVEFETGVLS